MNNRYVYQNIETGKYYNFDYDYDVEFDKAETFGHYEYLKHDRNYTRCLYNIKSVRKEKLKRILI